MEIYLWTLDLLIELYGFYYIFKNSIIIYNDLNYGNENG